GAGRSELAKVLAGLDEHGHAEVFLAEKKLELAKPLDAISHGIYLVPEDRRGEGLVTRMVVRENITLLSLQRLTSFFLIGGEREGRVAEHQFASLNFRTPGG